MSVVDTVESLRSGLDYHLARHNLLVSNLAQVDTPEYRPVDLVRGADFSGQLQLAMSSTEPGHMAPQGTTADGFRVAQDPTAAAGSDGNGVDIDREAVKIATNQVHYDAIAQLASSELASLAWAAGDGK